MTPREAIAMLDQQLIEHGETVTFRRPHDGSVAEATVKAFVTYANSSEFVGSARQTIRNIIISPTGLENWPGGHPDVNDWCVIADQECGLLPAKPKRLNDVLVRVNLTVEG